MSQKPVFSILSMRVNQDRFVAEISLDAGNKIYEGHFPGAPVTPGVIQLQMLKRIAEQHLGRNLQVKAIRSCKFLEVLNPEKNPSLIVEFTVKESAMIEVTAAGKWGESTFFKAQITYI
jgi:3-hydroxyacyl-[acyl-carrier-protein] dehydratase